MKDKNLQRAEKLVNHSENAEMASFEALIDINDTLEGIKETVENIKIPTPEKMEIDLTETNELLRKLLDKEEESVEVTITLE